MGRPRKDPTAVVRLTVAAIERIDQFAEGQGLSRADAVDRLLQLSLGMYRDLHSGMDPVVVDLTLDLNFALDAWITAQPEPVTRPEAVRRLLGEALG